MQWCVAILVGDVWVLTESKEPESCLVATITTRVVKSRVALMILIIELEIS